MKKILCILFAFGLISMSSYAQVASYNFSQVTNTFDTLTAPVKTLVPTTTVTGNYYVDTNVTSGSATTYTGIGLPIGFTFTYNGTNFNVFGVQENGWISLGQDSVNMTTSSATAPISATSTASAALQNRISAFGRALVGKTTGSQLSYVTLGSAPSRVLVIEWKRFRRSTNTSAANDNINFQIRLYETSNTVEFDYGTVTYSSTTASTVQVGLRGTAASGIAPTDFNNRTSTTGWTTTTAGTTANATLPISSAIYPASGLTYIFSTPVQVDAGISLINSPTTTLITKGINNIAVTIKNFGTDTLTSATIAWSVNGVSQTSKPWSGKIGIGITNGPDTLGTYNFAAPGLYTIKAWTTNPNGTADANHSNDTITKIVYVNGYATLPFSENFDKPWITGDNEVPSLYWANTPNTGNSSWRRNDDVTSAAWTTNATTGAYTPTGVAPTTHSARFHSRSALAATPGMLDAFVNFSTTGSKILKFWHINTSGNDSLDIYISNDSGATFNFVHQYVASAAWTQYTLNLGSSTSPKTIIRFKATNDAPANTSTDIGLDSIQVYMQPANDMAAISLLAPVTGCGHTASDTVTIRVANLGAATQTNVPVSYLLNGTLYGPEAIATINSGDTINYTFTHHANLSTAGTYALKAYIGLSTDINRLNDTVSAKITSYSAISSFPFLEDFNNPAGQYFFTLNAAANAGAMFRDTSGVNNTGCAFLTGFSSSTGWTGTGTIPASAAYGTYVTHHATLASCSINATAQTSLRMKFDLKQQYYTQLTYTWLVLIANGTDTLADMNGTKYYNPTTTNADPFTTRTFDLSTYAGTSFNLEFVSSCKYNAAAGAPGNNNYIDNINIYVPSANDAGITAINTPSYPVSLGTDSVSVTLKNYGSSKLTIASIGWSVNGITQTPHSYTNTPGLASNATAGPIKIGNYNFATAGFYKIKVWTSQPNGASDGDNTNDTISKVVYAQPYAAIPFLEGFDSTWINKNAIKDVPSIYWSNNPATGDDSWRRNDDTLSASWTNSSGGTNGFYAPAGADSTIHSARFHTWDALKGTSGDMDVFLNFNQAGGKQLDFWYMNVDGTDSLSVYLSTDAGVTFNFLQKYLTATTWTADTLYLGNSTSTHCVLRFKTVSDYTNTDIGIDQVKVTLISGALSVGVSATSNTVCAGSADTLSAHSTGGSGAYTYSWTSTPSGFTATSANPVVKPIVNTIYTVIVSDGTSTATNSVAVTVNPLPVVALGKDTSICKNKTITLDAGTGETSYQWSNGKSTETIVVDSTFANASGIATVWAEAINSNGCVSLKDTIVIHFVSCTGINEYNNNASIEMFPNPSTGLTSIAVNGLSNNAELTIYTLEGQSILSKNVTNNSITTLDLTNLSKGIYLVKLYNQDTNIMSKLIIQ